MLLRSQIYFYPRSPCGERPLKLCKFKIVIVISIHALLAESDPPVPYSITDTRKFLSTLSLRRATLKSPIKSHRQKHFYPRSPCGERRPQPPKARVLKNFYPRSPCGERQLIAYQSGLLLDFYPRSPCGERPAPQPVGQYDGLISIHALLAESDCLAHDTYVIMEAFLSTLSLRRATIFAVRPYDAPIFLSTLSLRRATHPNWKQCGGQQHFYPRSPCGERQAPI